MSEEIVFEELVLRLPPMPESEESGLDEEGGPLVVDDGDDVLDGDETLDLDIGSDVYGADDSLSWLDAGGESPELDVGGVVEEPGEGWLDDRPMDLEFGYEPEGDGPSGLDRGEEGLDEPIAPARDDDSVDLPPLPSEPVGADD